MNNKELIDTEMFVCENIVYYRYFCPFCNIFHYKKWEEIKNNSYWQTVKQMIVKCNKSNEYNLINCEMSNAL